MKQTIQRVGGAGWPAVLLGFSIAALVSCGGGGVVGSGGTGKAAGVTVGTVNGFGSVIVDGLRYDDRSAPVYSEVGPGNDTLAEVRLGHRVAVEYETAGIASLVRIEASLAGPVGAVSSGGQLTMLGQTVTTNTGASSGPITQFGGGYARAADVRAADPVEVHGLVVRQTSGYVIQATRIDKLPAPPAYLRVTGLASELFGASTLTLGALKVDTTAANVLPTGTALANGQTLTVLAAPGSLVAAAGGAPASVKAAQVRVRLLGGSQLDDYVSGSVSHLDTIAKTFTIGSLMVRYTAATLLPAGSALSGGQYVLVQGRVGIDGALAATVVTVRNTVSDDEGELKGNVSGFVAATRRFTVRGVAVDASGAALSGCPSTGLVDGLFVEVRGALVSTGVLAKSVQCEAEAAGSTVERKGTVGAVDTAAKTFTLLTKAGLTFSVKWTDTTFFDNLSPATLAGKLVQVEGQLSGSVLTAAKVEKGD
jgi:hypothetical protein